MLLAATEVPAYLPELTALLVGGAIVAYVGAKLRIVPIVAFLLVGVAIGPNALGLVSSLDIVNAAAEVGVILLLFTIGLEFSIGRLQELRRELFVGGTLQVTLATSATAAILIAAGVDANQAVFSGLLVALSSTVIVLKLVADRGEISAPHARNAVAVLLFQDLAIVGMVLLLPVLGDGNGDSSLLGALASAIAIIAGVLLLARRVLPAALERVARTCSPEIFLLSVMAICFGTAYATSLAGVSVALGAFLAGLVVSESRFDRQALGEVLPLQIIFSAVFFISIGMLLDLGFLADNLLAVLGAVAAILVLKAITTAGAMLALGQRPAVVLASALALAQVGEFSFVLMTAGATEGLTPAGLGDDGRQGLVAATVLLMAATPALLAYGVRAGRRMPDRDPTSVLVGRDTPLEGNTVAAAMSGHVIIAGYGRWARGITRALEDAGIEQVVATLSPDGAAEAHERGLAVVLGDPARPATLTEVGVEWARMVIVPDDGAERAAHIASVVRELPGEPQVVVRSRYAHDVPELEAAGADLVVTEEAEASAILTIRVLKAFGLERDDALARSRALRDFHREEAAPAAVRPPQHANVNTEGLVEVEVDPSACPHVKTIEPVIPRTAGCEECLESGDSWVHLRLCLSCGHVGCCDSSPNRHARRHHEAEGHHIVRSAEPGESWVYCFADDKTLA